MPFVRSLCKRFGLIQTSRLRAPSSGQTHQTNLTTFTERSVKAYPPCTGTNDRNSFKFRRIHLHPIPLGTRPNPNKHKRKIPNTAHDRQINHAALTIITIAATTPSYI